MFPARSFIHVNFPYTYNDLKKINLLIYFINTYKP